MSALYAAVIDRICAAVALSEITAVTPGLVGETNVADDTFAYWDTDIVNDKCPCLHPLGWYGSKQCWPLT